MPEVSRSISDGSFPTTEVLSEAFLAGVEEESADGSTDAASVESEWELIDFAPTPRMSTYLVAWAVGRFRSVLDQLGS